MTFLSGACGRSSRQMLRDKDPPVFALPAGFRALKAGQYFVAEDDTATRLDELCSSLRLRGIHCEKGEA